jgi:CheY-like chemotaxis protein
MDILIVENDIIVTRMWARKLSKEHSVRIADSVIEAEKEVRSKMPDLVILDLRLNGPTNSGLDIYGLIRQELKQTIPIIFITGLAYSVDLFQKAQAFTKADFQADIITRLVEKPVGINDLVSMVNQTAA